MKRKIGKHLAVGMLLAIFSGMSGMCRGDRLVLLVFLFATVLLGIGHFSLEVDLENTAMRSIGTPQAHSIARRQEHFGKTITLVLGLRFDPQSFGDRPEEWIRSLESFRDLEGLVEIPSKTVGLRTWVAELSSSGTGRDSDMATAFEQLARGGLPEGTGLLITGQPVTESVIAEELARENQFIVPLILAALFAALLWIYRSPSMAIGGLIPPVAGVLWVGGVQKMLGLELDPISSLLAPTLLAIGVASSVHVMEKYRSLVLDGVPRGPATSSAARYLLRPTALTVLTTIAGFLGLMSSSMPAVHQFGYLAGLGVALTGSFSLVILPCWLRSFHRGAFRQSGVASQLQDLGGWIQKRSFALLSLCLALGLAMGWQWSSLRVDTDPLRVLHPTHPHRLETLRLSQATGAIGSFEILIEMTDASPNAELLNRIQIELTSDQGILGPAGPPVISDSGLLRWSFLLTTAGTAEQEACFDRVEAGLESFDLLASELSGDLVLVARDSGELVRHQLSGLGFTLFCLWGMMALGLRSVRLAFLGLIPNLLPCLVLYGSVALIDRPLSVVSAMIGSVMLGVIVDDTIHLLHAHQRATRAGLSMGDSLQRSLGEVGRPILITSLVLVLGFGSGILGELETTKEFSVLACSIIVMALVSDLIFLPAALFAFGRRSLEHRPLVQAPSQGRYQK